MARGRFSVEAIFSAVDRITAPVSRMQQNVNRFTRGMTSSLRRADEAASKFSGKLWSGAKRAGAGITAGLVAAGGAVTYLMREFSKVENAEAYFTPLLGGAERAKEMVAELNKAAASTPFQFESLSDATGQLLPVMNGDIQRTIKTIRMLGDTAGGNAQKLDSVTRGFTKAMLKGKVDMESLNMIAEAGVPIFDDLAAVMGTKVNDSFFKMISTGKVGTGALEKAFERLTSEGGKFYKGMEIASKTSSGMWSTLMDEVSMAAAALGAGLAPVIKELIGDATLIAEKIRIWAEANKGLITERFRSAIEWIKTNFDEIVTTLKRVGIGFAVFVSAMVILKSFIVVMTAVNMIIALTATTFGVIFLAVLALTAAVAAAVYYWDEIKAAIAGVWQQFLGLDEGIQTAILGLGLFLGPIGLLIAAGAMILKHWEPIKAFFQELWTDIVAVFDKIIALIDTVKNFNIREAFGQGLAGVVGSVSDFFGGSDDSAPQVVTPQARTARTIEESRSTSSAEVVIRDESGRAVMENQKGNMQGIRLDTVFSGAF